ncbi:MAG: preprotein translocase subunit SecG [Phycisphaeraceae bacterium]|nr:preprotein translocase subunit SecG [Phycisphaeraceae bacterium]MCW5767812.1 preprotein translocase subunit SecG [Phycisphaeraceae bacterium]
MSPLVTLAANQWLVGGLVVLGIVASVLMILTILIQRPQGGGLAAAFGGAGAGSGQTAFGAKTGDALTIMTIVVFIFWLLVSMGLVYATKSPKPTPSAQQNQAPAGPTTPESEGAVPPAAGSMDPARLPETPATDAPVPVPPADAPTEGSQDGAAAQEGDQAGGATGEADPDKGGGR